MRKLNKVQKRILVAGILFFAAMAVYPPWRAITSGTSIINTQTIGYGLLSQPPESPFGFESYVVINYGRLFIQWAVVTLLTWFGIWIARKQ